MPEVAGSCPALHHMKARHNHHQGKAFSPLAQLRSQLDKVPRRPLLVFTTADQSDWVLLLWLQTTGGGRSTDGPVILTTSVAISSLLQRTAAPSSSGEQAEHAAFSPLALSQHNMRQSQTLAPTTLATVETWDGERIRSQGSRERSGGTASKAVA
jgi:hypothetical protein